MDEDLRAELREQFEAMGMDEDSVDAALDAADEAVSE